jgi:hypothetical protein
MVAKASERENNVVVFKNYKGSVTWLDSEDPMYWMLITVNNTLLYN